VGFNKDAVMGEVRGSIVIIDSIKTKILSTIILGIGLEDFEKIFPSTHREFFRQIEGKATPDDFFKMISIKS
jgi:CheY-specific phosphatase CheX